MRLLSWGATLAVSLLCAGCADPAGTATTALEDNIFLSGALAHTQSELELAQMAEQKARTPAVVAYAKSVAEHRVPLRDKLAALAQASNVPADTQNVPDIAQFRVLSGEAFERAYIASQIEDQQNAIDEFAFQAGRKDNQALQQLASASLPQLQADLKTAIQVVYQIPLRAETEAEPDMGAGLVGRRRP
jgi:putative membrane protein